MRTDAWVAFWSCCILANTTDSMVFSVLWCVMAFMWLYGYLKTKE